jgi:hypothetical protein
MKRRNLIVLIMLSLVFSLAAMTPNEELQQELDELLKEVENIRVQLVEEGRSPAVITIQTRTNTEAKDAAYFGFYIEDLTFPKAQALSYPENYGVIITGVVKDSPAWHYRLREDDIIMQIGESRVTNYAAFEKIRKSLRAGDQSSMVIFRDGKVESLDMTIGSRSSTGETGVSAPRIPSKKRLSAGYGGGTWIPMWYDLDMSDINDLITDPAMGFNPFRSDGILHQGLGGKFSIGKNYFLGGQVTWYNDNKKKANQTNPDYHIWMSHQNLMGGVTMDRRIPLSKSLITSVGLMVGGAYHELEFLNSDSNYDWNNLPGTITGSNNTHFLLRKGYLVAQPRAEFMYHFLSWLGLRAEVGYVFGYPLTRDWRVRGLENESYEVTNSPDTKYEGMTITIGPWFGF